MMSAVIVSLRYVAPNRVTALDPVTYVASQRAQPRVPEFSESASAE